MSQIIIPLHAHGTYGTDIGLRVELDDEHNIELRLDDESGGSAAVWRTLRPDEARALASALWHYASEAER